MNQEVLQSAPTDNQSTSLTHESFGSRILSAVEAAGDFLFDITAGLTKPETTPNQYASDVFWMIQFGPLGPSIRDSWFGK